MVEIKRTKCKQKKWLIAEIWDAWKMPQTELVENPGLLTEKAQTGQNIYTGASTSVRSFMKRFRWIHFGLKYKALVPALLILERIIGDKLDGSVPPEYYNKNLMIFNDAYEEAIKIWCTQYLAFTDGPQNESNPTYKNQLEHALYGTGGPRSLRVMKDLTLTIALNDTAYREFLNILCLTIAKNISEAYKDQNPIEHIFYTSKNISDVHYFHVMQAKAQAEANGQTISQILRTNQPSWFNTTWDTPNENKALDEMAKYYMNMIWEQTWNTKWQHLRDQVWTHNWGEIMKEENPENDPLWHEAWVNLGEQIKAQLWNKIWSDCGKPTQVEIKEKMTTIVPNETRKMLRDHMRDIVFMTLNKQLEKEVPPAIESMKWEPLWNNAWTKMRNSVRDSATEYCNNKMNQQKIEEAKKKADISSGTLNVGNK